MGTERPNAEELKYLASRTEIYRCRSVMPALSFKILRLASVLASSILLCDPMCVLCAKLLSLAIMFQVLLEC